MIMSGLSTTLLSFHGFLKNEVTLADLRGHLKCLVVLSDPCSTP